MPRFPPGSRPADVCAAALIELKKKAGNPSLARIAKLSKLSGKTGISTTTAHTLVHGRHANLPGWELIASFLDGCQRHLKNTGVDKPDLVLGTREEWLGRYHAWDDLPAVPVAEEEAAAPPDAGIAPVTVMQSTVPATPASAPPDPSVPSTWPPRPVVDVIPSTAQMLEFPARGATQSALVTVPAAPTHTMQVVSRPRSVPEVLATAAPATPMGLGDLISFPKAQPKPPLEPPQPVEQEATYAALNSIGAPNLSVKRMRERFGPYGMELLRKAEGPRSTRQALARLELGILLVNGGDVEEGEHFLQVAARDMPSLALSITASDDRITPRHGDHFGGWIPHAICREVAIGYEAAGRTGQAKRWEKYGESISTDAPLCLAYVSRGRHACTTAEIQYLPLEVGPRLYDLYQRMKPTHTVAAGNPRKTTIASARFEQATLYTTHEVVELRAMLTGTH